LRPGHKSRRDILALIDGSGVEFIGEIDEREKTQFFGEAAALLFPVDWPEPFGVVMIEAMACGTPVLAFRCGSIPEIIEDGITGKVVDSELEAIAALPEILSYDRRVVGRRLRQRESECLFGDQTQGIGPFVKRDDQSRHSL
jgi:glycosyltransferase involved in cell wall biosynthesis